MTTSTHHPIFKTVYVLTGLSKFFQRKSVKLVAVADQPYYDAPTHIEVGNRAPIPLEDIHKSIDKGRLRKIRKALHDAGFAFQAILTIPPKQPRKGQLTREEREEAEYYYRRCMS
jgi:hypothetical protein